MLFGVMVVLTEGYTSPFFTFFVFIVLSATIKWGWRATLLSASAVILLFFAVGWAALRWSGGGLELTRFFIRGTYLLVLSAVLVWFGLNQRSTYLRQLKWSKWVDEGEPSKLPIQEALEFGRNRLGAERAVFILTDEEEPWVELAVLNHQFALERRAPDTLEPPVHPELEGSTFIFDNARGRTLKRSLDGDERVTVLQQPVHPELVRRGGSSDGIVIPVKAQRYSGYIIAFNIPGLCTDDLEVAEQIGKEVSSALHRASMVGVSEVAAATRTRLSFARDLHDSVIQLLAGTNFRLEAIRRSAAAGRDIAPEIDTLQQELAHEQRELRGFIKQLRDGATRTGSEGLRQTLRDLIERLARQWDVECELIRCPETLKLPPQLEHDVCQLVREGVANAVRHGGAHLVSISADVGGAGLSLIVADDGSGFVVEQDREGPVKPWSLSERVRELGGSLTLYSSAQGSRITISIPWGHHA
jgi:signal transduction histidine kinase